MTLWSIGHSTRSLDELTAALRAHGIETVADVRWIAYLAMEREWFETDRRLRKS